jgi:hypothetical protein
MVQKMDSIVLANRPLGDAELGNFRLETAELPQPGPNEFLARTIWLSLDPYMRGRMNDTKSYSPPVGIDETMEGGCVAEVMKSNNADYSVGDIILDRLGWTSHGISKGIGVRKIDPMIAPISSNLGVLGMPGLTAWVGLNDILEAQPGETIVISAATGAVGSLAGQLAKLKGMRVIGIAGGYEKTQYAINELGYDVCIDHKSASLHELRQQISVAAPNGVDCYFENVGGKTLEAILPLLNTFARIALCGMIAWYSPQATKTAGLIPAVWGAILRQRLRVRGFIIFDHYDRMDAFLEEVAPMVSNGTIKYKETVSLGLSSAPQSFLNLLEGKNFGKQLVRIGDDPK